MGKESSLFCCQGLYIGDAESQTCFYAGPGHPQLEYLVSAPWPVVPPVLMLMRLWSQWSIQCAMDDEKSLAWQEG